MEITQEKLNSLYFDLADVLHFCRHSNTATLNDLENACKSAVNLILELRRHIREKNETLFEVRQILNRNSPDAMVELYMLINYKE